MGSRDRDAGVGRHRLWWVGIGVLLLAGLVYVMLLPLREAPFRVVEHEIEVGDGSAAIVGRVRNRGEAVSRVLVEAYLYDAENRYLGTTRTVLEPVPDDATVPFRIPLDRGRVERVDRYSLYAGTRPNPYAPEPR